MYCRHSVQSSPCRAGPYKVWILQMSRKDRRESDRRYISTFFLRADGRQNLVESPTRHLSWGRTTKSPHSLLGTSACA
ncbi:hypothetical protein VTN77DRAFT_5890 [Rasamsonia byssochlamydoides]|uniref:uncharacterized protein n=1 Tax=Rasamsonia byssochlamydoides TaxID=89139 RepID=UPI003743DC33